MLLHEFLVVRREEILEACRAELSHSEGLSELGSYVLEYFEEIVALLQSRPERRSEQAAQDGRGTPLWGDSSVMRRVRAELAQMTRRSRASLLMLGEPGTGRRHCARWLHETTYPEGEMFELDDVRDLPELEARVDGLRLLSSSQAAAGLTLYVHELTTAAEAIQRCVARLLSENRLALRVIASVVPALREATSAEKRRAEPSCRFAGEIRLPPLRERLEDLRELAHRFAESASGRSGSSATRFAPDAIERMKDYSWPGNLQELRTFVERVSRELDVQLVQAADLPELGSRPSGFYFNLPTTGVDLTRLERELLTQALAMTDNNQTRAAGLLGLTRDQIRYRLAKFALLGAGR